MRSIYLFGLVMIFMVMPASALELVVDIYGFDTNPTVGDTILINVDVRGSYNFVPHHFLLLEDGAVLTQVDCDTSDPLYWCDLVDFPVTRNTPGVRRYKVKAVAMNGNTNEQHYVDVIWWPIITNLAPNMPNTPIPADGATDVPVSTSMLEWAGGDPDSDTVFYDVYFDDYFPPLQAIELGTILEEAAIPTALDYDTTYYWAIIADDGLESTVGPVWSFTTEEEPNLPPTADFTWQPVTPEIGELTTFTSNSSDQEDDELTYEWSFDGIPGGDELELTHVFSTAGNHDVKLSVSDGINAPVSITKTIEVVVPQLVVTELMCFPRVIVDNNQSCSVQVRTEHGQVPGGVTVDIFMDNIMLFGTCTTNDISGSCEVKSIQLTVGNHTVHATAERDGYISDMDQEPSYTYSVEDHIFDLINLEVFGSVNDMDAGIADYEYYRGEDLYLKFQVVDLNDNDNLVEDAITSAWLTSPPGGMASLDSFEHNGDYWYFFRLDQIPLSHEFLGDSVIFAFAFENLKGGGQREIPVKILNNLPQIAESLPDLVVAEGDSLTADLSSFKSDLEDSGDNLTWAFENNNPELFSAELDGDELTVTGLSHGTGDIDLVLSDLDGDSDEEVMQVIVSDNIPVIEETVADPGLFCAPEEVAFSATIDGGNLPFSYAWYYGDGSSTTGMSDGYTITAAHTFQDRINYNVYFNITDADGDGSESSIMIYGNATCEPENYPPYNPHTPSPANGAVDVPITTGLSWHGGDPDGDTVYYTVKLGTNPDNLDLIAEDITATSVDLSTYDLDYSETYYWKVRACDTGSGICKQSDAWQFTTEEENHHPYNPHTPSPANGSINVPIDTGLSWHGGDPDQGNTVTYDVYLGTDNSSGMVNNHPSTTLDPGTLEYDTVYYWQVTAKDNHGAETEGPVWTFTTEEEGNQPPVADFTWSPEEVFVGDEIEFNSTSSDPENDPLTYVWDLDDDGTTDATAQAASWTFYTDGPHDVTLTVSDSINDPVSIKKTVQVITPVLEIIDIECFDRVINGSSQSCSVQVRRINSDIPPVADVTIYYADGTVFGECTTDHISGGCEAQDIQTQLGDITVYAEAEAQYHTPDNDHEPTYTYEVVEHVYNILGLAAYDSLADMDAGYQNTIYYRGEDVYIKFQVEDFQGNFMDEAITSAELISEAGGRIALESFDHDGQDWYFFKLEPIPLSHDFIGDSWIFSFAFDNAKGGGQASIDLTILNNLPVITGLPVVLELALDQELTLQLSLYGYDLEDSDENLSWTSEYLATAPFSATLSGDELTLTPLHEGQGDIVLTLHDLDNDFDSKTILIDVVDTNLAPIADPNGPYAGRPGELIQFSSEGSNDPDGEIVLYEWDFGDGATSDEQDPTHAYAGEDTYAVTLTVTDNASKSTTAGTTAVIANVPFDVVLYAEPTSGPAPLTVTFQARTEYEDGVKYYWNFGDGNGGMGRTVQHTYKDEGDYTATMYAVTDLGDVISGTVDIDVGESITKDGVPRRRLELSHFNMPDTVEAGSELPILVNVDNNGKKMKDLKIVAMVRDIDARYVAGPMTVKAGDEVHKRIMLYIPDWVEPGVYDVMLYVGNDLVNRVKYREIEIVRGK
ncbi:MAG: PKD domain-containing protein [Nanoarchaeota archaeon]|nr:PKD domain-containing protein [Nanoarchaeota archaeon]